MGPCPILINNQAGLLRTAPTSRKITQIAQEIGLDVDVITTRSASHMRSILRRLVADHVEQVAVAGGDGTVAVAGQEVARSGTILGIIPLGTFNNFAASLHLPLDIAAALRVLDEGVVQNVDLGRVGGRYFTEAAGIGLFADWLAIYGPRPGKNIFRVLLTVARIAASYRSHRIGLVADGRVIVERGVLCTAANTRRTASAIAIAPNAQLSDGKLDVVVVGDLRRIELLAYFRALLAKRHLELPKVTALRAEKIAIESPHRMKVHADDQIVATTPAVIEAVPQALQVLVERPSES